MVQFIAQPQLRFRQAPPADFSGLGDVVSNALRERALSKDFADAAAVDAQGGSAADVMARLAGGRTIDARQAGLTGLLRARAQEDQRAADEAAARESRDRFDIEMGLKRDELGIKRGKEGIDKAAAEAAGGFKSFGERVKFIQSLRKEFSQRSKDFATQRSGFDALTSGEDTPAGDIALIFNYMRILDPGSRVTEGEVHLAGQTTGVPGRIINMYNRIVEGGTMNKDQRADFRRQAKRAFEKAEGRQKSLVKSFGEIADRSRIDRADIFTNLEPDVLSPEDGANNASPEGPPQVNSLQEALQLPPGTQFIDPQGTLRVVPQ